MKRTSVITAIVLIAYLALLYAFGGNEASMKSIARIGAVDWVLIIALSLANYLLRGLRWHALLRLTGHRLSTSRSLAIYVAGFAFTATPAKAGEAARAAYLRPLGVPVTKTLSLLYVERLLDVAAVALLALGAIGLWLNSTAAIISAIGLVVIALGVLSSRRTLRGLKRLTQHRDGRIATELNNLLDALESMLRPSWLSAGLVVGVVAWLAEGVGLVVILHALGNPATVITGIGIYSVSMLAGAASLLPGGVGGTEAAMMAGLVQAGVAAPTSAIATIICRLATLWFAVALGGIAVGGLLLQPSHQNEQFKTR